MSEKFSLKWNEYHSNWNESLAELRNDTESADVTLISDDKVKFSGHRILLSSCSDTFKFILKGITHANPLLYLSGVSSINLGLILDYIYYGEVKLFQEQLDSFLESSQKLEIKGLLGDSQESQEDLVHVSESLIKNAQLQTYCDTVLPQQLSEDSRLARMDEKPVVRIQRDRRRSTKDIEQFDVRSMTTEEIDAKIKELYHKVDGAWRCMVCDYSTTNTSAHMKMHIETHLDGLSYTCPSCSKEFRSNLKNHVYLYHK